MAALESSNQEFEENKNSRAGICLLPLFESRARPRE